MSEAEQDTSGAFYAAVSSQQDPLDEIDRYAAFRAVFFGSSSAEQGQQVLSEIMKLGFMGKPMTHPGQPIDPYRTHLHEGRRTLAMEIYASATQEPVYDRPERASTKEEG